MISTLLHGSSDLKLPLKKRRVAFIKRVTQLVDYCQTIPETEISLADHPAVLMAMASMPPDPWQAEVLEASEKQLCIVGSRQCGKSRACAALVISEALKPNSLILVLSPTDRQSKEFLAKVRDFWYAAGRPKYLPGGDCATQLTLSNRSRVIALPDSEGTIRSYSDVKLLVIDEASRVSDELYLAVRPMLAVSGGRLVVLSTPFGKQGWFWEAYAKESNWRKWTITADMAPRVKGFMEEEKAKGMPERYVQQEFFCTFLDPLDSVFRWEDLQRMEKADFVPAVSWE